MGAGAQLWCKPSYQVERAVRTQELCQIVTEADPSDLLRQVLSNGRMRWKFRTCHRTLSLKPSGHGFSMSP
jgi:hypothetical protein